MPPVPEKPAAPPSAFAHGAPPPATRATRQLFGVGSCVGEGAALREGTALGDWPTPQRGSRVSTSRGSASVCMAGGSERATRCWARRSGKTEED